MKTALDKHREVLNRVAGKRRWFDISNQEGDVAEVRIYDEVSWFGLTAEDFARELDAITAPEILVMINSPGGNVFDGVAIYNILRSHPARVTTRVDGVALSIASVIAQAGDHRVMLSSAQMMIHDALALAIGNASDMREMADILDRQSDNLAGIYAARGSKDKDHYRALMRDERWFTDEEAVAEGLADEVVDPSANKDAPVARTAKRTLQDEVAEAIDVVSETVDSAERVAALRSDHGERLSQANRSSLGELAARVNQLLDDAPQAEVDEPDESDDFGSAYARSSELLLSTDF